MHELFVSLKAYEMRITGDTSLKKEATSNTTKKGKEVSTHKESSEDSNAKVEKFVRKLKRGSDRYKGKLPLKCFNCGKVKHFVAKCPHKETGGDESREFNKSIGKNRERNVYLQGRRGYRSQNNLYTIEDDTTDEENTSEDDHHENAKKFNLFMALGESIDEDEEEEDIEAEVDWEGELISVHEKLSKTRKEIKKVKLATEEEVVLLRQSLDELSQDISNLKLQLEETKRICEDKSFDLTKKEKKH